MAERRVLAMCGFAGMAVSALPSRVAPMAAASSVVRGLVVDGEAALRRLASLSTRRKMPRPSGWRTRSVGSQPR